MSSPIRGKNSPGTRNVVPYTSSAELQSLSEVRIPSKTTGRESIQWSALG